MNNVWSIAVGFVIFVMITIGGIWVISDNQNNVLETIAAIGLATAYGLIAFDALAVWYMDYEPPKESYGIINGGLLLVIISIVANIIGL